MIEKPFIGQVVRVHANSLPQAGMSPRATIIQISHPTYSLVRFEGVKQHHVWNHYMSALEGDALENEILDYVDRTHAELRR